MKENVDEERIKQIKLAENIMYEILKDCEQKQESEICGCVSKQVNGLLSLKNVPQMNELYDKFIGPISYDLDSLLGKICREGRF